MRGGTLARMACGIPTGWRSARAATVGAAKQILLRETDGGTPRFVRQCLIRDVWWT